MTLYEVTFDALKVRVNAPTQEDAIGIANEVANPVRGYLASVNRAPKIAEIKVVDDEPVGLVSEAP